ncbi:MAG: geranylgeranylglycerol-phosphate geranylgeranyltransferase [Haloarculaceae archaeon]
MGVTARGLLDLTRPVNAIAAGSLTAIGAVVAGAGTQYVPVATATVTTVLAVAAGNAINDYFDREIDSINRPDRPLPRGEVSPRGALAFAVILFGLATALALTLPLVAIVIAGINLAALVAYTELFKGLPGVGNAIVAYLVGSTFLFGGAAVGKLEGVVVLAFLAAASTFTREVIKDVEDIVGDREEGLRTLPIVLGERRSLWVATAVLGVAVAASPLPYLLDVFGVVYLILVVPADAVMLSACYESFSDPTDGQTHIKYGMFLAAGAFVVGRAVAVG